ncbi:MAG TPA: hypothetical protein VM165_16995 [Planctomycetaceae bacterium]|nr:hypothetical protein [Planctomycetaceae bacterium]
MHTAEAWRTLFENWPEAIPRQGILVMSNESIPFRDFLISGSIVLVERETPDSQGARKVMVAYEAIAAVKITSPMDLARFQVMGFQAPF